MKYKTINGQVVDAFKLDSNVRLHISNKYIHGYAGDYLVIDEENGVMDIVSQATFNIAFAPVFVKNCIEVELDEETILESAKEFDEKFGNGNGVYDKEGMPAHPYVNADKHADEEWLY